MVITAVLVAALVLSVGGSAERRLANASERFQDLFAHACNQAELSGREIGVAVSTDGYAFSRFDADRWQPLPHDGELRARQWPRGMRIELSREGRLIALATSERPAPQLVCFSSGEATPFALAMRLGDAPMRYRITGSEDGTLTTDRSEARP